MTNRQRLQKCFQNALGAAAAAPLEELRYGAVPAWDSVTHIALVMELESCFGTQLTPEDIVQITDYGTVRKALERHGVVFED